MIAEWSIRKISNALNAVARGLGHQDWWTDIDYDNPAKRRELTEV